MWDYSDKVLDHFMNPRNVGEVENPDGIGEVGSMACGDALRLSFRLDENQKIADARFQTFGCGSAIASSSILTEMVIGKTIEEALALSNQDIADALGGLPREKMHCSVMGREALEAAVIDHYKRQGRGVPCTLIDQDVEICNCYQVKRSTILEAIRRYGLETVEDVTDHTKAGGGCRSCHADIEHLLADVKRERESAVAEPERKVEPTDDLREAKIRELLEHDIARSLRSDGGDIELVRIDGDNVFVRLTGACASCPASQATIKGWVEKQLREMVGEDLEVTEVRS